MSSECFSPLSNISELNNSEVEKNDNPLNEEQNDSSIEISSSYDSPPLPPPTSSKSTKTISFQEPDLPVTRRDSPNSYIGRSVSMSAMQPRPNPVPPPRSNLKKLPDMPDRPLSASLNESDNSLANSSRLSTQLDSPDVPESNAAFGVVQYTEEPEEDSDECYEDGLIFSMKGMASVKGGPLDKLLELLCDPTFREPEYEDIFIQTYQYFMTPMELFKDLQQRWDVVPDVEIIFRSESIRKNRIKICDIFTRWITQRFEVDFTRDGEVLQEVTTFIDRVIGTSKGLEAQYSSLRGTLKSKMTKEKASWRKSAFVRNYQTKQLVAVNKDILDYSPHDVAQQLTVKEFKLFKAIKLAEYSKQAWMKSDKQTRAPNLITFTRHFNNISMWVASEVLSSKSYKKRAEKLDHFIKIVEELLLMRNFNGAHEIIAGMGQSPVVRLKQTWEEISSSGQKSLENMRKLLSTDFNYKQEREVVENKSSPYTLPYIGMYLSDLVHIEDGNPSLLTGQYQNFVNFNKYRKIAKIFKCIQEFQQSDYSHLVSIASIRQLLKSIQPMPDSALYEASYAIIPRGSPKTEAEIEKEEVERESEIEVLISVYDEEESKEIKLNINMTVKQAKDKIFGMKWKNKISPSDYDLYLPNNPTNFAKYGGLCLVDNRTMSSYRLKSGTIKTLILAPKGTVPSGVAVQVGEAMVTIYSEKHKSKKTSKIRATSSPAAIVESFLKRIGEPSSPQLFGLYFLHPVLLDLVLLPPEEPLTSFEFFPTSTVYLIKLVEGRESLETLQLMQELTAAQTLISSPSGELTGSFGYSSQSLLSSLPSSTALDVQPPLSVPDRPTSSSRLRTIFNKPRGVSVLSTLSASTKLSSSSVGFDSSYPSSMSPSSPLAQSNQGEDPNSSLPTRLSKGISLVQQRVINLSGQSFSKQELKTLLAWLETNKYLTHLDLSRCNLGDSAATKLGNALQNNTTLQYLNLSKNNITHNGFANLENSLRYNFSLIELELSEDTPNVDPQKIDKLRKIFQSNRTLLKNRVAGRKDLSVRERELQILPREILEMSQLTSLDVSCNKLSQLPQQISLLENIIALTFEDNLLEELPVELTTLKHLRDLNLRRNKFTQVPSVLALLEGLEDLNLEENSIERVPFVLGTTSSLTTFRICDGNPIKSEEDGLLPRSLLKKGDAEILAAMKSYLNGTKTSFRKFNLIFVGEKGVGKTSLVRSLLKSCCLASDSTMPSATSGPYQQKLSRIFEQGLYDGEKISLTRVSVNLGRQGDHSFYCWDFHSMEQNQIQPLFQIHGPSNFLVIFVFSLTETRSFHLAKAWISQIVPSDIPIISIGTHLDLLPPKEIGQQTHTVQSMIKTNQQQMPNLRYFVPLSTQPDHLDEINPFKALLLKTALELEMSPSRQLTSPKLQVSVNFQALEERILVYKKCFKDRKVIPFEEFEGIACKQCMISSESLRDVLCFLQRSGILVYFSNLEDRSPIVADMVYLDVCYAWTMIASTTQGKTKG